MKYTISGIRPQTMERYCQTVEADNPRAAEDKVQEMDGSGKGHEIYISGVFEGDLMPVDTYAKYVDPDRQ